MDFGAEGSKMKDMRRALVALGPFVAACAHGAAAPPPEERVVLATVEDAPAVAPVEAPPARPRLSRTVTLGQGNEDPTYGAAPAPQAVAPPPQSSIVVQNNVTVGVPAYYGGYYGYGSGGYAGPRSGYGEGRGRPSSSWGTDGWEGARRTAAPGKTPGVGGNWPAPPSYGPAQMK
jgi:hypothetical protein